MKTLSFFMDFLTNHVMFNDIYNLVNLQMIENQKIYWKMNKIGSPWNLEVN